MTIYRKLDNKSIATLECIIPIIKKPKVRLITRIQIPIFHHGKGVEAELLKIICELSDKDQIKLYFSTFAYGGKSKTEIIKIMKKHNFILLKDYNLMYRLYAGCKDPYMDAEIDEMWQYLQGDD
jgi:hypothetical protein